ncbi:alpha/beta hydrolase family protein [Sphaerochaeta sp.]|uniref:alpha/beta hydrolase family protein n=1 Tax=Sphaerochaeta sp. TaxID=1972642 RepID=UPI003D0E65F2
MDRALLLRLLGEKPAKQEQTTYSLATLTQEDGYRYIEISYQACDGETVQALLLIPDGVNIETNEKHPTIIAHHQHGGRYDAGMLEPAGLCENPANTFALSLCKAGFIVLCPEQIGFGRRREKLADGHYMDGQDNERWLFVQYYLRGRTLLGKCLFDLECLIDVISSLPFVDKERIGICGHSMGGLIAYWFGWYEKRIKAIASVCGFSSLALLQKRHLNHTFTMYLPGILNYGDTPDLLDNICPKPLYLTFGAEDRIFPVDASLDICRKAQSIYTLQEASNQCIVEVTDDGHVFTEEKQVKAAEFFRMFL